MVGVGAPTPSLREAGLPSTSGKWKSTECCARLTGGSHALITDAPEQHAPEQHFNGVNLRRTLEVG